MAIYNVSAPDGTQYHVEAPDGATQDQVMAYVQQQHGQGQQAQPQQAQPAAQPQPPQRQGFVQNAVGNAEDFARAAAHHVANIPVGLEQLAGHAVTGAVNAVAPGSGVANYANAAEQNMDQFVNQREQQYQQQVPNSPGAYAGAAVGEVAPWVTGLGELRAIGAIPEATSAIGRVASLAAEGGTMGAVQPVTNSDNYALSKGEQTAVGAVTAPALVGAGKALGAIPGVVQHVTNPGLVADANVARLYGSSPEVQQALSSAPQLVSGETPTAAQVLNNPQAYQIERTLRNNPASSPTFVEQGNAANQARLAAVQNVAGDDTALVSAKTARDMAVAPYRQNVLAQTNVDPSPVVSTLQQLSKNANPAVRGAANDASSVVQSNLNPDGTVPASVLDDIRQQAGKFLAAHATNGIVGSSENARYAPLSTQIAGVLDAAAPGYRDYLATYGRMSQPISDMETAQKLLGPDAPGSLNTAGDPQLALARVKQLLRQDNSARYPMSPSARSTIEGVRDSLMRASSSNAPISASGPQTAADMTAQNGLGRLIFGSNLGHQGGWLGRTIGGGIGATAGGLIGGPVGGVTGFALGSGATDALGAANNRVIQHIAASASNAQEAHAAISRYLQQSQPSQANRLMQYLLYGNKTQNGLNQLQAQ